jgi:hypothetical protein
MLAAAAAVGTWIALDASLAHAHGGMVGPEQLGPPLTISICLALASYWLVILWPAPKKREEDEPAVTKSLGTRRQARHSQRPNPPMRLVKKVTPDDSSGTVER